MGRDWAVEARLCKRSEARGLPSVLPGKDNAHFRFFLYIQFLILCPAHNSHLVSICLETLNDSVE